MKRQIIINSINLAIAIIILLSLDSCKKFNEANIDPKANYTATPDALFASATKNLSDIITSSNVNYSPFRLWAQYWTETTYTDESNYNITSRNIPDQWFSVMYARVLQNYQVASDIETASDISKEANPAAAAAKKVVRLAIIDVMKVYAYSTLVELFGDVPYSEATKIGKNLLPAYDKQTDIYKDLIDRLYKDIDTLKKYPKSENFGPSDLIYKGVDTLWGKFANSMLLRMGMMIVDVPTGTVGNYTTAKLVQDAVANGVFTSNADNALFRYISGTPNTNPLYVDLIVSNRQDFVACKTFIDTLRSDTDNRYKIFFDPTTKGAYTGGVAGAKGSNYSNSAHANSAIFNPTLPGVFLSYAEVAFLLAEAAQRNIGGVTNPADYYEKGITASADYWVANQSDTAPKVTIDIPKIIAKHPYPTDANEAMKAIAFQLWIALYNQGFEGWTQWRRLDYPTLPVAAIADNTAIDANGNKIIPKRFTYPITEEGTNQTNWRNAVTSIGGNNLYTHLFWDRHNNQWGTSNQKPALSGN